jgi:hypothetical protein
MSDLFVFFEKSGQYLRTYLDPALLFFPDFQRMNPNLAIQ